MGENMPSRRGDEVRTVRLLAEEMAGGWTVAVWWYGHDGEGNSLEGDHLRATVQIPIVDTDVDNAWLVLMTAIHMLEDAGSVGNVRAVLPRTPPAELPNG